MTQGERDAIQTFPSVAREFCCLIEDCNSYDRSQLVRQLSVHLARLCEVGARLPFVEPATEGVDHTKEEIAVHTKEWKRLFERLRQKFGDVDGYWELFDPTEEGEVVGSSLADDVAEIYLDLKDSLELLAVGADSADTYWEWQESFRSHWSRHAASALKVTLFISDFA